MTPAKAFSLLESGDYAAVIEAGLVPSASPLREALAERARGLCEDVYGENVFVRGLVEISSFCKNDCLYCGLRASNAAAERYRLTPAEITDCARDGFALGLRTIVLQGGEDARFDDDTLCRIIADIKDSCPGTAVTLSLGERTSESYARLREAGADRYLLRHETADRTHYAALHPPAMSFGNRMRCLADLRRLGYQTGCGFMVGSPGQTAQTLAEDVSFIASFRPEMCGIGPFIPHHATPFARCPAGSVETTCLLLSIIRIVHPHVLLPATTAMGTLDGNGREKAILSGANVVMPNLSPRSVRTKYAIYDNKACSGEESSEGLDDLSRRLESIGRRLASDRGDYRP